MSGAQPRRADAGTVRLTDRDVAGLLPCAEHYAAPYDLLASALDVRPGRLRGITARWRAAGYVSSMLGTGPARCWLAHSRWDGRVRPGLPGPALARLAHIRAVLARRWLQSGAAYSARTREVALGVAHPRRPAH
jgi:hypothetical protein